MPVLDRSTGIFLRYIGSLLITLGPAQSSGPPFYARLSGLTGFMNGTPNRDRQGVAGHCACGSCRPAVLQVCHACVGFDRLQHQSANSPGRVHQRVRPMRWANPWKLLKELERKLKENQELAQRVDESLTMNRLRKEMAESAQRFEALSVIKVFGTEELIN